MVPSQLQSCSQCGAAYLSHLGLKGGPREFFMERLWPFKTIQRVWSGQGRGVPPTKRDGRGIRVSEMEEEAAWRKDILFRAFFFFLLVN